MTVYLNGAYLPVEDAKISVMDRGFLFGDGIYEVVPVYSRKPFRTADHLRRMQHSLDGIKLPNPLNEAEWVAIVERLVAENPGEDQYIYLQVTRGAAPRDHPFPNPPVPPTVFAMSGLLTSPSPEMLASGVPCITATDYRWLHCDIKAISLLPNVLLRQLSVEAGCAETILIREGDGEPFLTEGTASNVFVVKNGRLIAPPKDNLVLPGITYDVVLELAASAGIPCDIRRVAKRELFDADELLITSSTKEVMSVTHVDGQTIGKGKPGPVFEQLYRLYQDFKRNVMRK